MKFIKLTMVGNGYVLYFNMAHILYFAESESERGSYIQTEDNNVYFCVKETPDQILTLIKE